MPLPSSATITGLGKRSTTSPAWRFNIRIPARLKPYSGRTQITSKSAEPTSSYKYLDGSSFCPGWLRPMTTSEANSDRSCVETDVGTNRGALDMGYSSLFLYAPEGGVDVGVVRLEPIAKRPP